MKKTGIFLMLLLCAWLAFGEHVSFADARQVAVNWIKTLNSAFKDQVALTTGEILRRDGIAVGYVFHFSPAGYMLVAAEDYLPPVKLYSLKNDFAREGRDFEDQVIGTLSSLIRKVNAKILDPEKYFLKSNRDNFSLLKKERPQAQMLTVQNPVQDAVPFLRTAWNQGDPYNLKCPTDQWPQASLRLRGHCFRPDLLSLSVSGGGPGFAQLHLEWKNPDGQFQPSLQMGPDASQLPGNNGKHGTEGSHCAIDVRCGCGF